MKSGKRLSHVTHGFVACAVLMAVFVAKAEGSRGARDTARSESTATGVTPVMFSLFTPVEIPWWHSSWDVSGVRFCLPYGSCRDFSGLDLGVVTHATSSCGVQLSAVNVVDEDIRMTLSVGGLVNTVGGSYTGCEIGGLVNVVNNDAQALQVAGVANVVEGSFTGAQVGFVNVTSQAKDAWQIGFWNQGEEFDHCGQIGLINFANDMNVGVQFGAINIIRNNEYPCIPFMNCHF